MLQSTSNKATRAGTSSSRVLHRDVGSNSALLGFHAGFKMTEHSAARIRAPSHRRVLRVSLVLGLVRHGDVHSSCSGTHMFVRCRVTRPHGYCKLRSLRSEKVRHRPPGSLAFRAARVFEFSGMWVVWLSRAIMMTGGAGFTKLMEVSIG